jgi:hypothetical protein
MANKLNNSFLEPQYLCDICSMAVTNPLCPACLATEIEAWLTLYPDLRGQLLPKLKRFIENTNFREKESTQCIKCGNNTASICPYCFTNQVLKELKKLEASKIILREFFEFFNFDLDHTGYSSEAEELGVI